MRFRFIYLWICTVLFVGSKSQNRTVDSLTSLIKNQKLDSNKIKTLNYLSRQYYVIGDYENALKSAQQAGNLSDKINFLKGKAASFKHIGNVYSDQSNFIQALNNYFESLKISEKLNDKLEIAKCNNNISGIYRAQNQYRKALSYLLKTLNTMRDFGDSVNIARCNNNIGDVYIDLNLTDSSFTYFSDALRINQNLNDPYELALSNLNMGRYYYSKQKYKEALGFFQSSLELRKAINDIQGASVCYALLGQAYFYMDKYKASISYTDSCLEISKEIGDLHYQSQCYALLSQAHYFINKYKEAYLYQKLYKKYSDSIFNEANSRELSDLKTGFEVEKKENEMKAKAIAQEVINSEEQKRQRLIIIVVVITLIIVVTFSVFLYRRFKITQRQKNVIEEQKQIVTEQKYIVEQQKHLIEEKHKEITDSINYAERIQRSFLATKQVLDENLKEHFVMFRPKDVVSGDFYWASKLNNGNFALVTADSTGHGVPGAIMSLLNITSLERSIETQTDPAEILNSTRKIIIERLKKDGSAEGGKDGMDCSLISFDFKNKQLHIAAAHNPVWIIRDNEVIEIKPDKMPVGKHDREKESFITHSFEMKDGDVIYALTDGFPDQFGGPKGKKFMSKNLRELIIQNSHLPIKEQKLILENVFKEWLGKLEQVDDVTVIGVRV